MFQCKNYLFSLHFALWKVQSSFFVGLLIPMALLFFLLCHQFSTLESLICPCWSTTLLKIIFYVCVIVCVYVFIYIYIYTYMYITIAWQIMLQPLGLLTWAHCFSQVDWLHHRPGTRIVTLNASLVANKNGSTLNRLRRAMPICQICSGIVKKKWLAALGPRQAFNTAQSQHQKYALDCLDWFPIYLFSARWCSLSHKEVNHVLNRFGSNSWDWSSVCTSSWKCPTSLAYLQPLSLYKLLCSACITAFSAQWRDFLG